jgi:hypothetical protein
MYIFVIIATLSKNKKNNKVLKNLKNKYATKILRYIYFAFLKAIIAISILII